MEGLWETRSHAPLLLFAWPDEAARENRLELAIPALASVILKHSPDGVVAGLNDFPGDHPPVAPVFFGFRLMVGMGLLMLAVAWFASLQLVRGRELPRWLLRMLVGMTFAGWVASLAGWYVTEIGRQPWLVWGILRTSDAVTDVPLGNVVASFSLYAVLSAGLLASYVHVLFRMARQSVEVEEYESQDRPGDSARAHFSGRTV